MEEHYNIKLPLFEGPLDLLLHLIRENKVDIYDIPIALITQQYLEHIELMKELSLEVAGEFLLMASTLVHIKSRMLLPVEETADTDEPEDPRYELVQKLLAYQAFKESALGLKEREHEWANILHREPEPDGDDSQEGPELSLFDLNLFDLIDAFKKILDRAPAEITEITKETLTIQDKISIITEAIEKNEALRFEELFMGDTVKSHYIVTFVALLEVLRLGLARAYQEQDFGTVWIIRPGEEPAPTTSSEAEIGV
jgi:segregation and condensation protein A